MINKKIVFTAPWEVEFQEEELQKVELEPGYALVKKRYTLISPGTELACLSGGENWFHMPDIPGYSAVSEIIEIGENEQGLVAGDFVFHYGKHVSYEVVPTSGMFIKVPEYLDLRLVPFTRMATVAFTSVRVSNIELGDTVAVTGMGLVGNMASQLARLQGANVIGIDLSENRLKLAEQCGLSLGISPASGDITAQIKEATNGVGVSTFIEATGVPKVAVDGLPWIAQFGELIFLGSPRGEYMANVTDIFNYSHLIGRGSITFKGAHEWRFPVAPEKFVKHSLVRNSKIVMELIRDNKLLIEPIISHTVKPEDAKQAYEGLRNHKDEYNGVLFDWS